MCISPVPGVCYQVTGHISQGGDANATVFYDSPALVLNNISPLKKYYSILADATGRVITSQTVSGTEEFRAEIRAITSGFCFYHVTDLELGIVVRSGKILIK